MKKVFFLLLIICCSSINAQSTFPMSVKTGQVYDYEFGLNELSGNVTGLVAQDWDNFKIEIIDDSPDNQGHIDLKLVWANSTENEFETTVSIMGFGILESPILLISFVVMTRWAFFDAIGNALGDQSEAVATLDYENGDDEYTFTYNTEFSIDLGSGFQNSTTSYEFIYDKKTGMLKKYTSEIAITNPTTSGDLTVVIDLKTDLSTVEVDTDDNLPLKMNMFIISFSTVIIVLKKGRKN